MYTIPAIIIIFLAINLLGFVGAFYAAVGLFILWLIYTVIDYIAFWISGG